MTYTSASQHGPDLYDDMGLPISSLGCVMLDTMPALEPGALPAEWLYYSDRADEWWVKGLVGATSAHVTLLYGLIPYFVTAERVDVVLMHWGEPESVFLGNVEVFSAPNPDDPWACLVATIPLAGNPLIEEAHHRLSSLPHIDTHAPYKAHLTLAYVRKEFVREAREELLAALPRQLGTRLGPEGSALNYGDLL